MPISRNETCLSIIICTYNGTGDISECIESLLEQDFSEPYEILVVDDGSTDQTVDRVNSFESQKVRLISKETNDGLSAARNTGWRNANGDIVTYIDDDAVAPQNWIQSIHDAYLPDVDGVGGYPKSYYDDIYGEYEVGRTHYVYGPNAERISGGGGMNMSFKKESLASVEGFDEQFTHMGDDDDVNRRLAQKDKNLIVDPSITVYHKFPNTFNDFCRTKFLRGLGEAMTNLKYEDDTIGSVALRSILSPFSLLKALYEGFQISKYTDKGTSIHLGLLAYLHAVLYRWGVLYYQLKMSYESE